MAINTLQVAWLSRLTDKGIIACGKSMVEFSPQDVLAPRHVIRQYGLRHNSPEVVERMLNQIFDAETPRSDGIPAFYRLFGVERYRSLDLLDVRANWIRDFSEHVKLNEQFDLATNFGTAEHVFGIGNLFHSIHDALRPGGVALHVLPAFGDIDHGFYNIHPTLYFDLAAANGYTVEDICYVDRWDIRNKMLEANLAVGIDFDALPIRKEEMKDRDVFQRLVTERFVANYNDQETQRYGECFPGVLYDYCVVALRKNSSRAFRPPVQGYYRGPETGVIEDLKDLNVARLSSSLAKLMSQMVDKTRDRGVGWLFGATLRRIRRVCKALLS